MRDDEKENSTPAHKGGTRLTPEQAAAIVDGWTREGFCTEDDEIGDFLALLYTVAGTEDATERENYVIEIEAKLLPMSPSVGAAIDAVVVRRVREATKGEAVN